MAPASPNEFPWLSLTVVFPFYHLWPVSVLSVTVLPQSFHWPGTVSLHFGNFCCVLRDFPLLWAQNAVPGGIWSMPSSLKAFSTCVFGPEFHQASFSSSKTVWFYLGATAKSISPAPAHFPSPQLTFFSSSCRIPFIGLFLTKYAPPPGC